LGGKRLSTSPAKWLKGGSRFRERREPVVILKGGKCLMGW
jgi:hypothetical protein